MVLSLTSQRVVRVSVLALTFFLIFQVSGLAAKRDKQKEYVMTEIELQSELMSYADRFASIITQAYVDFETLKPSPRARQVILRNLVRSKAAMYTIAAEPNPHVALLDAVAVTTLGRMIYEDNIYRKYGKSIAKIVKGFRQLEKDIWQIAAKVLTTQQQTEMRQLIELWRKNNPDMVVFNYLRFSDFAAQRRTSTLVKKVQAGGIFKTVKEVNQQAEEMRMLAERGIYLGTRLPLLMGDFSEVWMAQMILNPEAQKVLADVHTFSRVSERMAKVAEQMPDKAIKDVAKMQQQMINQVMTNMNEWTNVTLDKVMAQVTIEREAFIDQFMNRLWGERKNALEALMKEEQRITALVKELRKTIEGGNNLMLTVDKLADKSDVGESSAEPEDSEPFDIKDYQDTIADATTFVKATNQLVDTVGLEKLLPELISTIDRVESEGEELIDHSFRQAIFLILIALGGYLGTYIIARLIYSYLNKRLIESRT